MQQNRNRGFNGYQSPLTPINAPDQETAEVAASDKAKLAAEVEEYSEDLTPEQRVAKFLEEYHGISQKQIDAWKREHGQIYLLPLDDNDIYVYRPIKSIEFQNLMIRLQNVANASADTSDIELVRLCLVYPKIDPIQFNTMPAGFLSTMRIAIQKASRFLSEEEITNLTIKL